MHSQPRTDPRCTRAIERGTAYRAAVDRAIALVRSITDQLERFGDRYTLDADAQGITCDHAHGVWLRVSPSIHRDGTVRSDTLVVRIYGPQPAGRLLYGKINKRAEHAGALALRLSRYAHRYRRPEGAEPPILVAARERVSTAIAMLGPDTRVLSGCEARRDLPGGARLHVSGQHRHDVRIENLTGAQLRVVLRAIARTIDQHQETPT